MKHKRLENTIFKFLDEYLGNEFYFTKTVYTPYFSGFTFESITPDPYRYVIYSVKTGEIFSHITKFPNSFFIEPQLAKEICSIFNVNDPTKFILDWFKTKNSILIFPFKF